MAVTISTEPDLNVGEPVPLFSHERYQYMQGRYITPSGELIFVKEPFNHDAISEQLILVRNWRNFLNDASATP